VEKSNSISLSPDSIKNILTLRYNLSINPTLPKLTDIDFTSTNNKLSIEIIEKSMVNTLKNNIDKNCKKIAIALSAGIDSTLNLAILRKTFPDLQIKAISMQFADSIDETPQAAKIAEHFGVEHDIIHLDNFLVELPKAISITKQPFWDLHWYHIVKKAKSHCDYLVSGDGGDELFSGYTFRYKKIISLINEDSSPIDRVKAYLQCHERDWVKDQPNLFGPKARFSWKGIHDILIPYFDNSLSLMQQVFLADYNGKLLYNFSPVNSKLHEHFRIKSIVPLLSKDLISYATHLETNLKYDQVNDIGKLPLRKLLSNYIDNNLLSQNKLGFSVNTVNLWKSHGYKLCKKYLDNSRIVNEGWINSSWIENNLKNDLEIKYINKFLGLLALEIWHRIFVTKEMNPDTKLSV
jgi:asparagine synthase (glutamine-hydrolysing)